MHTRERRSRAESQERTRTELIEAAHKVFLLNGFKAASLQAICDEAACTTGAIYSNFSGKEELFFAVVEKRTEAQQAHWKRLKERFGAPDFRLKEFGDTLVAALPDVQWQDAQAEFRSAAVGSAEATDRLFALYRRAHTNMTALIERFCTTYGITPPRPYDELAILTRSVTEGLLIFYRLDQSTQVAELFTAAIRDLLLGGAGKDCFP